MGRKKTWRVEEAVEAIRTSESWREVLRRLGLRETGGNFESLKRLAEERSLDTTHMLGKAWLSGRETGRKKAP